MIRGTKRPLEKTLDLRASIHNRFDVEVIDAFTGEVKQRARAFNLICDALWTRLLNTYNGTWYPQSFATYVLFGSGSGTPSASDTALFSLLGARSYSGTLAGDVADGVVYRQGFITLQAEEYVGATLTEVGVGYDSTHIVTHALLEDMNGNPISIEKSATDVIRIYATIYVHFSAGGWYGGAVSVLPFSSADYNDVFFTTLTGASPAAGVSRPLRFSGAGKRTGEFTAMSSNAMVDTVDAAAKKVSASFRIPADSLNFPIRALRVFFQLPIGGYNDRSERLLCFTPGAWAPMAEIKAEPCGTGDGTSTGFSTAFPVKAGGNVYVDGVQASGVSVRPGPADGATLEQWMNLVQKRSAAGTPVYQDAAYSINADLGLAVTNLQPNYRTLGLENPFTAIGIASISARINTGSGGVLTLQCSDDLASWTDAGTLSNLGTTAQTLSIPQALRTKRYWRLLNAAASTKSYYAHFVADVPDTAHNIVFASPPAAGAVITCDYVPDCIAKDENHVFDLTLELTLGEYSEA